MKATPASHNRSLWCHWHVFYKFSLLFKNGGSLRTEVLHFPFSVLPRLAGDTHHCTSKVNLAITGPNAPRRRWPVWSFNAYSCISGQFRRSCLSAVHLPFTIYSQMDNSALVSLWPNLRAELCPFPRTAFIIRGTHMETDSRQVVPIEMHPEWVSRDDTDCLKSKER